MARDRAFLTDAARRRYDYQSGEAGITWRSQARRQRISSEGRERGAHRRHELTACRKWAEPNLAFARRQAKIRRGPGKIRQKNRAWRSPGCFALPRRLEHAVKIRKRRAPRSMSGVTWLSMATSERRRNEAVERTRCQTKETRRRSPGAASSAGRTVSRGGQGRPGLRSLVAETKDSVPFAKAARKGFSGADGVKNGRTIKQGRKAENEPCRA